MASILLHTDRLEIKLTAAERVLALRKDSLVIPRDSIRSVALSDDPWIWVRGVRAPGTAVPLTLALGQWKFHGGKDFLVLKGSRPAVVIDLIDEEFRRVLVSTRKGVELIAALRLEERKPRKVRVHHAKPRTKAVAGFSEKDGAPAKSAKKAPKKPAATKDAPGTAGPSTPEQGTSAQNKSAQSKSPQSKSAQKKTTQAKQESQKAAPQKPDAEKPDTEKTGGSKPPMKKPDSDSAD